MKFFILSVLSFLALTANDAMLKESNYKYVKQSIGQGKPFFLEVGSDSCYSCQEMGKKLYKVKQAHKEYQLHFINVGKNRQIAYELRVMMIPTQIIYDKTGKEVYRHIGLLSDEDLNTLFKKYGFKQ